MRDDYPLYIKWRYIVEYLLEISGKFPKNVRFNLADRITNISLDVLEAIIEAVYTKKKADALNRANLNIEKIRALLQICMNKKYISIGQYEHISVEVNEAGKMLGGWVKSCKEPGI
ncbi:MAG: S23 ribosomal protein [Candidatus Aerophobetes bacterium ADurb.Bin490]|nr:MAG: S23 ribosomal protein [Candidatus Aerophobetes bacterium ADurb.Bin490]